MEKDESGHPERVFRWILEQDIWSIADMKMVMASPLSRKEFEDFGSVAVECAKSMQCTIFCLCSGIHPL